MKPVDKTGKTKGTRKEHLEAVQKLTGIKVPELKYTEPDSSVAYLVNHFFEIKKQKGLKISFTELKAYSELMFCDFEAFEIQTIMTIDDHFERI